KLANIAGGGEGAEIIVNNDALASISDADARHTSNYRIKGK
ncbi:unnamed protein product, partial [Urochloa humidicola]